MGAGDPGMEDIYHWDADGPRIAFKGPEGTRRMQSDCSLAAFVTGFLICHSSGRAHC